MVKRGFTIVELIIVIMIICTLAILGVVNLRGSMASSRDTERKSDVSSIATHLETYYESGDPNGTIVGEYPSTQLTASIDDVRLVLNDIDFKTITAPGVSDPMETFISAATTSIQSPTVNQYIYQPIAADGSLCTDTSTQECVKYNLYYMLETDSLIYTVKSKNQ